MQLKPTVALWLDTRYELKSKDFMLKLRVTFNVNQKSVQKYYSTGLHMLQADWEKINSKKVPFHLRKMREAAIKFEHKANGIINSNPAISPTLFEALYAGKYAPTSGVSTLYNEVIDRMTAEGRISTASAYRCSMLSLKEYRGDFPLNVVDVDFLEGYEKWMLEKGETVTTVGFYLRALRAIFNIAIEKHIVSIELYPFGRKGYRIPKGSNYKKALKNQDKVKLEKAKPENEQERRAIAMWMFSYYANGMNFTDMAYLKPSNIHAEVITFVRRKTMRTVREVKPIVVPIRPEMKRILKQYGSGKEYCFEIINEEMTPQQRYRKIQDWIKFTNKYVNAVADRLKLGKVNSYNARHTFATMLLQKNVNLKAIQQSLGHRTISTTEAYLADLDIEEAKKISKLL